jgi:hypothetical protein
MKTHRTSQVEFTSEGLEVHDWGIKDRKGRPLGSSVALSQQRFEPAGPEQRVLVWDVPAGHYFAWVGQALRDGQPFGTSQCWKFCKTQQERALAVRAYLVGARERAQRWAA